MRLDLGIGGGLDGDGEAVVGVVSCEMENNIFNWGCVYLRGCVYDIVVAGIVDTIGDRVAGNDFVAVVVASSFLIWLIF